MDPPRYKVVEPKNLRWSRVPSDISIRTLSPIRSRPLKFRFPFLGRAVNPEQESESEPEPEWESNPGTDTSSDSDEECIRRPRCRDRSRRLFVVDNTDKIRWARRRTLRSPPPKTRPRTKVFAGPDYEVGGFDISFRCPQLRQLPGGSRPPRERTPVSGCGSPRRGRGPRIVEIHNGHRVGARGERGRSPVRRQVRFASDVEFEKNTNRVRETKVREREHYHVRSPHRHITELNSDYGTTDSGATCRLLSPERTHTERWRRTRLVSERARPQIIHDGNYQMSEAAERLGKEAWRQHSRESLLRDLKSHSGWHRCARRSDERILYGRDHRQFDWRWL
ncbi:hypothetical protein BBP40_009694 [Aspergillus hancockii]|nr:hypothetical protein BBP40_009694 [Aspergillus hancockii]